MLTRSDNEIIEKERKIAHLESDLREIQEKNSQIVNLESKCKTLENVTKKRAYQPFYH